MKKFASLLLTLFMLCLLLLPVTALASDYDYIENYDITVTPQTEDGSLLITAAFDWMPLEDLPAKIVDEGGTKIGIPNGSIRDVQALTDNIADIQFDNSYIYIDYTQDYPAGKTFHFAYSWVQEYMYTLSDDGSVSYDYTPGWFDEIRIGHMRVTWKNPDHAQLNTISVADSDAKWYYENGNVGVVAADHLDYGQTIHLNINYANWPTELSWDNSSENLPNDDYSDWDDGYWDDGYYYEDGSDGAMALFFVIIVIVFILLLLSLASRRDGYAGGFGTRYVYVNHLWYPMGPDGRPRPGSVGTPHRPKPPINSSSHSNHSSHGGGFGSSGFGSGRGGGFGGGGFGGGGHCACASSCACACACACAGGGRAGCSAKNLYGAVQLNDDVSENLGE